MGVNDDLSNSFVTLAADLERFNQTEISRVVSVLEGLQNDLVKRIQDNPKMTAWKKARYNALISQSQQTIKKTYTKINKSNQDFLSDVAGVTAKATRNDFKAQGIPIQSVVTTQEQYKALASSTAVFGSPARDWWSRQSVDLQNKFADQMRMGYAAGESNDNLLRRVRGQYTGRYKKITLASGKTKKVPEYTGGIMDVPRHQAEALVRTSSAQLSATAKRETFKKNSAYIKGIMQSSTLDLRTTPQCAARDGKMWTLDGKPIGHSIPYNGGVPLHYNCRSTEVPVTKSFADLEKEEGLPNSGIDQDYLKGLTGNTRASMDGQVPQDQSFEAWFQSQSEERQRDYLGRGKYQLWKDKGLSLPEMIDQSGNPLSLRELADKYGYRPIGTPAAVPGANALTDNLARQLEEARGAMTDLEKEAERLRKELEDQERIRKEEEAKAAAVLERYKAQLAKQETTETLTEKWQKANRQLGQSVDVGIDLTPTKPRAFLHDRDLEESIAESVTPFIRNNIPRLEKKADVIFRKLESRNIMANTSARIAAIRINTNSVENVANHLKKAWQKIIDGKTLTQDQEGAIQILWHEVMHNRQLLGGAWPGSGSTGQILSEVMVEMSARHTYPEFLKSLGSTANYSQTMIKNGMGYQYNVNGFRRFLGLLNISEDQIMPEIFRILGSTERENYVSEIVDYVFNNLDNDAKDFLRFRMVEGKRGTIKGEVKSMLQKMIKG